MKQQGKNINYTFKLFYAILIFFVACGHCYGGGANFLTEWFPFYSFHMAAFMFASGYFYNPQDTYRVKAAIKKKSKKVLLPLYLYNFSYALILVVLRKLGFPFGERIDAYTLFAAPLLDGRHWGLTVGGWYVGPLFFVFCFNLIFQRLFGKYLKDWMSVFLYLVLGMIGIHGAMQGIDNAFELTLYRCAYFIPFYGFGIWYRSTLEKKLDRLPKAMYFGGIWVFQLALITFCNGTRQYSQMLSNEYDNVVNPFVFGVTGILFWLGIAKVLTPLLGKNKYVLAVSNNAFSIMMNQYLGYFLVRSCFAGISFLSKGAIFKDFDWSRYFTDYIYNYQPRGLLQWESVYVFAGILIPIFIQKAIDAIKAKTQHTIKVLPI